MFVIEQLQDRRTGQPSARHVNVGRVWCKIGKPVARLAVAERIHKLAMIDRPTITRIRVVPR
jgi:hypothetical protein